MSKSLGIIGTAGRKDDALLLSYEMWGLGVMQVLNVLKFEKDIDTAVSGGAAWADHIAVYSYLEGIVDHLILHLPCKWDMEKNQFYDSGIFDSRSNPGGTANYYHRKFNQKYKRNSLNEISQAINKGATVVITEGFLNRNTKVANDSDILLALTFGNKEKIKNGGTADTARKYLQRAIKHKLYHYDLNNCLLYSNGTV